MDNNNLLFALDIGTRSMIGLVGEKTADGVNIIASERLEHHSRAMFDGQIHDVPEVAAGIRKIKQALEETCGKLDHAAVAAAGRALITIRSEAEMDTSLLGTLTKTEESTMQLLAIKNAQKNLSKAKVSDPLLYYCVGYSVIEFTLDGTSLTSLIGQRGQHAVVKLIATFLPRQVIDSMQSALKAVELDIATLTLEPIAAISVLIPPTMRHLNLALVDIGAGTSDIAITAKGTVIAYGMVPIAGDEITEAISQRFLLDFNVAEQVKRQLSNPEQDITFTDVLGMNTTIPAKAIIEQIAETVNDLAQAIAKEMLSLNAGAPQAVLLVGGGSLTPLLPDAVAQALDIIPARVAVRQLDAVDGIIDIPENLRVPDAITPLGILNVSTSRNLNFIDITFNKEPLRLFNLGTLTIADAVLSSGIDIRSINGHPGMGFTISINGETQFIRGTYGTPCTISLNGKPARLEDGVANGDEVILVNGTNGESPKLTVNSFFGDQPAGELDFTINNKAYHVGPAVTVNGQPADSDYIVRDRDTIIWSMPRTLAEILDTLQLDCNSQTLQYIINEQATDFIVKSKYLVNNQPAADNTRIASGDEISIIPSALPTISDVLGLDSSTPQNITITFNGKPYPVKTCHYTLHLNGVEAFPASPVPDGSIIQYEREDKLPILSEVIEAVNFEPPQSIRPGARLNITVNDLAAEFTTTIKNGDKINISLD